MATGNRNCKVGVIKLVRKKPENGNGNRKVRSGIIKLVRKKPENGNGEP